MLNFPKLHNISMSFTIHFELPVSPCYFTDGDLRLLKRTLSVTQINHFIFMPLWTYQLIHKVHRAYNKSAHSTTLGVFILGSIYTLTYTY